MLPKKNQRPLEVRHRLPDHACTSSSFPTEPYGYVYETSSAQRRRVDQSRQSRGLHVQRDGHGQQPLIPRQFEDVRKFSLPPVTPIRQSPRKSPVGAPQAIPLTLPVVRTASPGISEDFVFMADTAHVQALTTENLKSRVPTPHDLSPHYGQIGPSFLQNFQGCPGDEMTVTIPDFQSVLAQTHSPSLSPSPPMLRQYQSQAVNLMEFHEIGLVTPQQAQQIASELLTELLVLDRLLARTKRRRQMMLRVASRI